MNIGDKLVLQVNPENREWGYNPGPDGTEVEVVGFEELAWGRVNNCGRKPGVYENGCYPKVRFPNGEIKTIGSFHLKPYSPHEDQFLRDLPETAFWEWDLVDFRSYYRPDIQMKGARIEFIDWNYFGELRNDGRPMPPYQICRGRGGSMNAEESELTLVERGLVWKYHHQQLPELSVEEEARLHCAMGLYDEIPNPKTGLYLWKKEEILGAIENGIAHGMKMGQNFFSCDNAYRPYAIKLRDETLGQKVAALTLKGFS